jgi:hypothetical protein
LVRNIKRSFTNFHLRLIITLHQSFLISQKNLNFLIIRIISPNLQEVSLNSVFEK